MAFSSLVFVCIFMPIVFLLHSVLRPIRLKNALLIAASLLFYAFGEPVYVFLMLLSALFNYVCGLLVSGRGKKLWLALAVAVNVGVLCVFKYAGFFVETLDRLTGLSLPVPQIALPIGISFFTFQALSYVIDVYRGQTERQKSFARLLLYISFFPQLIAGPIVKYRDVAAEIEGRRVTLRGAAFGLRRFIWGLGKKILVANTMAVAADFVFSLDGSSVNVLLAWIGAVAYLMQIYYDFSGYSDMAIGLGLMFGFHFRENFNYPYAAATIKDFWRRWHISLSSWFKDYVYIPLGGNRCGRLRTGLNKLTVFFLPGLWHGANWTFVVWGLFHGLFSFLEEAVPSIRKLPRFLLHLYTMLVVTAGFVIFRADDLSQAVFMLGQMFGGFRFSRLYASLALQQLTPSFLAALALAVVGCGPLQEPVRRLRALGESGEALTAGQRLGQTALDLTAFALLACCLLRLSGGSYNPFIYFRF